MQSKDLNKIGKQLVFLMQDFHLGEETNLLEKLDKMKFMLFTTENIENLMKEDDIILSYSKKSFTKVIVDEKNNIKQIVVAINQDLDLEHYRKAAIYELLSAFSADLKYSCDKFYYFASGLEKIFYMKDTKCKVKEDDRITNINKGIHEVLTYLLCHELFQKNSKLSTNIYAKIHDKFYTKDDLEFLLNAFITNDFNVVYQQMNEIYNLDLEEYKELGNNSFKIPVIGSILAKRETNKIKKV